VLASFLSSKNKNEEHFGGLTGVAYSTLVQEGVAVAGAGATTKHKANRPEAMRKQQKKKRQQQEKRSDCLEMIIHTMARTSHAWSWAACRDFNVGIVSLWRRKTIDKWFILSEYNMVQNIQASTTISTTTFVGIADYSTSTQRFAV
jgi:hypothetical protein